MNKFNLCHKELPVCSPLIAKARVLNLQCLHASCIHEDEFECEVNSDFNLIAV